MIPNPTNRGLNRIRKFPASVPTPKGLSLGIGVRGMGRASRFRVGVNLVLLGKRRLIHTLT
jgi:hypothetical protein